MLGDPSIYPSTPGRSALIRASPTFHHVTHSADSNAPPSKPGLVVHWAARYDALLTILTLGRERRFREQLLQLAHLEPGESVLDMGCGTGTLAIAAKRKVGGSSVVHGIDPSPEMIARAHRKARRVLKPGGRLLAVDFATSSGKGLMSHFHRHGRVDPRDLIALATGADLNVIESGPVGRWDLQFVLARREEPVFQTPAEISMRASKSR